MKFDKGLFMLGKVSIVFTSLDDVCNSVVHGLESFLQLAQIQDNRSFISEKLKTGFTSEQSVNHISDRSIDLAHRYVAHICRLTDDDARKDFIVELGKKIKKLVSNDDGDSYITSMFPFIAVSVFHRSTYIVNHDIELAEYKYQGTVLKHRANYNSDIDLKKSAVPLPYDPEVLVKYYLAPDTRHKHEFYGLYNSVGSALSNIKDGNQICQPMNITSINPNSLSTTQKLNALVYFDLKQRNVPYINSIFKDSEINMFDTILKGLDDLNKSKNIISRNSGNKDNNNPKSKPYQEYLNIHFSVELSVSNFAQLLLGVQSYVVKYDRKANDASFVPIANSIYGWNTESGVKGGFDKQQEELQKKLASGANQGLSTLYNILTPDSIYSTAASIIASSISYSTKSKGYGIVNRHGVTGQIRALQLKLYVESLTVFVENQYKYVLDMVNKETKLRNGVNRDKVIPAAVECTNEVLKHTLYRFYNGLSTGRNNLSSKGHGSLSFYLNMYATPKSVYKNEDKQISVVYKQYVSEMKPNKDLMNEWQKDKLHKKYIG